MGVKKNTVVRGCLIPSLKNKPLDGRQDVPKLVDIENIENPFVNFIFPVAETGKWYKVLSLKEKAINDLVIPDGAVDEYEEFGKGMTDEEKQAYLSRELADKTYQSKEDAEEFEKGVTETVNTLKTEVTETVNTLVKETNDKFDELSEQVAEQVKDAGRVDYIEMGDLDLDDVFDNEGMEAQAIGEFPDMDIDNLN